VISAELQLQRIEDLLLRTGGTIRASALLLDPFGSDSIGTLTITMVYPHGHRLHVSVTVDVTPGYPDWVHYGFQLLGIDGRCVFRYDNAPHHRHLETFPHHKHVGPTEKAEAHHLPTLHDLVAEIAGATAAPTTDVEHVDMIAQRFAALTESPEWLTIDEIVSRLNQRGFWEEPDNPARHGGRVSTVRALIESLTTEDGFLAFSRMERADGQSIYRQWPTLDGEDFKPLGVALVEQTHRDRRAVRVLTPEDLAGLTVTLRNDGRIVVKPWRTATVHEIERAQIIASAVGMGVVELREHGAANPTTSAFREFRERLRREVEAGSLTGQQGLSALADEEKAETLRHAIVLRFMTQMVAIFAAYPGENDFIPLLLRLYGDGLFGE
jgi:hypothetical protein